MGLGQFINLFLSFFLANIASRYVGEYVDEHVQRIGMKRNFDKELADKLFRVCNSKIFYGYLDDIHRGVINKDKVDDLRVLLETYRANRFFNKKLQGSFDALIPELKDLVDFMGSEFSVDDYDNSLLRIHKYRGTSEGHVKYENNRRRLEKLLDHLDISARNLEEVLIKRFPELAMEKLG